MTEPPTIDSDLPPPPYSRHDPNAQAGSLRPTEAPVALSSLAVPPGDEDPSTYVADGFAPPGLAPAVASAPTQVQAPESSFTSAQSYFDSRQPGFQLRSDILPHFLRIPQNAAPSDIPFPSPHQIWVERDVTFEDWTTFLNYLFPHHLAQENARILTRKLHPSQRADNSSETELVQAHIQQGEGYLEAYRDQALRASCESEDDRRRHLQAVIREWNDGFFFPRALRIDPYIESANEASSSNSATTRQPVQTMQPSFVYRVTNHDASEQSSFPPSHGWEQFGNALDDRHNLGSGNTPGAQNVPHPDARYSTEPSMFGPPEHRNGHGHGHYRVPHFGPPGPFGRHVHHGHHGHRGRGGFHGHHRHMSDSSAYGGGPRPWNRPYLEQGTMRRGRPSHGREHSFSRRDGPSPAHRQDSSSSGDTNHLSPNPDAGPRPNHGHVRSASVSDPTDITRTKTALQRFFSDTLNDVSMVHENFETLVREIHAERREKQEDLKNEWRENFPSWSQYHRRSRSARSSVSENNADGPLSPRSTASTQSTRTSAECDNDLAKAMKQSFKSWRNEMKLKQKADKAEWKADQAALKESEKLHKDEEKARKECGKLRKRSSPTLGTDAAEPMATSAVASSAPIVPTVASSSSDGGGPSQATPSSTEAEESRAALPVYNDISRGWSGSSANLHSALTTNESDEHGVERGTI